MFSALLSFLGGSVFRMIWGEVASFFQKRQDHEHEVAMLRMQAEIDDKAHARTLENLRLQADLNVRQVEVQRDADVARSEADAFNTAMQSAFKPTGFALVDVWNGVIRPLAATIVIGLWVGKLVQQGFSMDDYDKDISAVVLGFFFADRSLRRNGK